MTRYTDQDRVVALAGVFQSVSLVDGLARKGELPEEGLEISIGAILNDSPVDVISVYRDLSSLRMGLTAIVDTFGAQAKKDDMELLGYILACMHLERKLNKDSARLRGIQSGIAQVQDQVRHFSLTHENVIANIASIYVTHVSQLKPRVMVKGERVFLANPRNINRIRSLLLSAIRSAVLWQQCGGGRLDLLVKRRKIAAVASDLLR